MQCSPTDECDVDCGYTDWTDWTECSEECNGGFQERTREGGKPPAQGAGAECDPNQFLEGRTCNMFPCPVCVDDESGESYEVGEIVQEETCYKRYCNDDLRIVNETIDNPACLPTTTSEPTTTEEPICQLTTISETLRITDADGTLCVSAAPVELSVCQGSCPGSDRSPVTFKYDPSVGVHNFVCECCQGSGSTRIEVVDCSGVEKEIEVMVFDQCGCSECQGSQPSGNESLPGK